MLKFQFVDENDTNYRVSVPVLEQEKPMRLRMWVAYEKGKRFSDYDYQEVKRGYYFYLSLEEVSFGYPARMLTTGSENCRVYLGAVNRHSKGWYRDFSRLAEKMAVSAVHELFSDFKFDWENSYCDTWSGQGSGVGLYCDFYTIVSPKVNWIYAETNSLCQK